jgi:hypothetical protein
MENDSSNTKNSIAKSALKSPKANDPKRTAYQLAIGLAIMEERRDILQALADAPVDHSKTKN